MTAEGATGVAVGATVRVGVGLGVTPGEGAVVGFVMTLLPPPPGMPPLPGSVGVPAGVVALPGAVPWITWICGAAFAGSNDMPITEGPVESRVSTAQLPFWS